MTDGRGDPTGHEAHLISLGFPAEVAREAGRAARKGLFDLRPSDDLVERTIASIDRKGTFAAARTTRPRFGLWPFRRTAS